MTVKIRLESPLSAAEIDIHSRSRIDAPSDRFVSRKPVL
jgi:hypothetical protein